MPKARNVDWPADIGLNSLGVKAAKRNRRHAAKVGESVAGAVEMCLVEPKPVNLLDG